MTVLIGTLLLTYAFAVAPATTSGTRDEPTSDRLAKTEQRDSVVTAEANSVATDPPIEPPRPAVEIFPPAGKAFIGAFTQKGPYDFTALDTFTTAAKHQPQVMLFSSGWAADTFDRMPFDQIKDRGMLPMLGWEPWDYRLDETARRKRLPARQIDKIRSNQPAYRLSRITRGDFDPYLRSWAEGIKSLGYPVAIRFAHEMNGDWYPWCAKANGNRPGDYVKAWRHVHDLFQAVGATNVIWVWSPNARWSRSTVKLSEVYPGDDYVDWVGATGYYGTGAFSRYRSFDAIFNPTIAEIRAFTRKPMVITETGASDGHKRKAEWIRQAFQVLPRHKDIIGLIWFEVDKELDWRVVSSPASAAAFAKAVANPRYQFSWSPDMVPRTGLDG
ncbi:glycoside hydrolase family 26 protein [Micromonospora sp. DR5-3]|uniref:glycoside hydrolase family 26 protein n=1 Tax=unclassified Micromonospora TaxID=2617518 RepID=UPI00210455D6|nr:MULTISPECIES: glycosyl hydrolase [unclassified Micromonospora]MCW3816910.1 glycoside hydrolase family 26 protein [Micromonospora sp. DR5-3]